MTSIVACEQYKVFTEALPLIINGDASGLTDAEERMIDSFLSSVTTGYDCSHVVFTHNNTAGLDICCITGLLAETSILSIHFMRGSVTA